jgi:hypothetical protein
VKGLEKTLSNTGCPWPGGTEVAFAQADVAQLGKLYCWGSACVQFIVRLRDDREVFVRADKQRSLRCQVVSLLFETYRCGNIDSGAYAVGDRTKVQSITRTEYNRSSNHRKVADRITDGVNHGKYSAAVFQQCKNNGAPHRANYRTNDPDS